MTLNKDQPTLKPFYFAKRFTSIFLLSTTTEKKKEEEEEEEEEITSINEGPHGKQCAKKLMATMMGVIALLFVAANAENDLKYPPLQPSSYPVLPRPAPAHRRLVISLHFPTAYSLPQQIRILGDSER
ncbi:hypothetical protein CJ030_MR2G000641 [Morella rubra]|uniref:Uncharacterized protein n=1 Tax=Morella rubra TaxID=262757 RepID=A0A6A1WFA5_9ROSI|nr:hypothetical protein CJ030_MR2G000641 [Morella rubra]